MHTGQRRPARYDQQSRGTQFTCFTSTEVLALLVQQYWYANADVRAMLMHLEVLSLLALPVQTYKY
jgi:hypothetical protein